LQSAVSPPLHGRFGAMPFVAAGTLTLVYFVKEFTLLCACGLRRGSRGKQDRRMDSKK
jgi:hypothetical protein